MFNFFGGVRKIYIERQNLLVKISTLMSGKTRTFVTNMKDIQPLKNIFNVKENEEILTLDSIAAVQNLVNFMAAQRGKKIFFLLLSTNEMYKQLRDVLQNLGFIGRQDFLNCKDFFSEINGVPLDSWEIIKNL